MKFIELCAGAGGCSTGLMNVGFLPLVLNDIDADCCETLKRNHRGANVVCSPMMNIDWAQFTDRVDLVVSGAPCQSWSQAGNRKGLDDSRGDVFLQSIDIIHTIHPKVFMIENVRGLLTHNGGKSFQEILDGILFRGKYDVQYALLNAMDYAVPQKRERVFLIGTRKEFSELKFEFPKPLKEKMVLRNVLENVPNSLCAKYSPEKARLFAMIPQGGCWIHLPVELQKAYLGKSYESGGGKRGILRRLSMDEPSLTLLCSPSQKQTERCHPLENRPLSVREYARIQTFPDDYSFYGSMSSQYKQIGNAIPVRLAECMGVSIRTWLEQLN